MYIIYRIQHKEHKHGPMGDDLPSSVKEKVLDIWGEYIPAPDEDYPNWTTMKPSIRNQYHFGSVTLGLLLEGMSPDLIKSLYKYNYVYTEIHIKTKPKIGTLSPQCIFKKKDILHEEEYSEKKIIGLLSTYQHLQSTM